VFSPDGQRVAYVTTKPGGFLNVNVRSIHNGDWTGPETAITEDHRFGKPRLYFADQDFHTQPSWLRDGSGMLLVSNRNVALGSGNVWRIPIEHDAMQKAKLVLDEQSLYRTRPDVSPDGKSVIAQTQDSPSQLRLLTTGAGEAKDLTKDNINHSWAQWFPDGKRVLFSGNEQGKGVRLYVDDPAAGKRHVCADVSRGLLSAAARHRLVGVWLPHRAGDQSVRRHPSGIPAFIVSPRTEHSKLFTSRDGAMPSVRR
jgi:Tol biopolymer transport system component